MKPMLAATTGGDNLNYPVLVSPKLDGVRALIIDGVVMSRSLKPIPNKYVQKLFGKAKYNGLDGELIVGDATAKDAFQATTSGVMSVGGRPNVWFYTFDTWLANRPFEDRLMLVEEMGNFRVYPLLHTEIENHRQLLAFEHEALERGYEGIMIRDPQGLYKHGRSTLKQGWLLKLKRFCDSEAEIIGFTPKMHNTNEAKTNAIGYQERSHKQVGLVAVEALGAITVYDKKLDVVFDIGTGFTEAQRQEVWRHRESLYGELVKYKYQPAGVKDKPRFPVFLGFRDGVDL